MGALLRRFVLLVNKTNHKIELKESRRFAPPGIYPYTIQLNPLDDRQIPATMFHQRAIDASRPTVIKIFCNDVDSGKSLTPQDFIDYRRITFKEDKNGELIVTGVRATSLTEQFSRIRLVDFVIRGVHFLMGQDDRGGGQQEDQVIT